MKVQVSLFIVLWVGLACNTDPVGEVKELNVMSAERPWHEHTVEDPGKTSDYRFIVRRNSKFGKAKDICVALEVGSNSALKKAYDANRNAPRDADLHDAYLAELAKAKILCMSRYLDNRHKDRRYSNYRKIRRNMFSYFDGTSSKRVFCWHNRNKKGMTVGAEIGS